MAEPVVSEAKAGLVLSELTPWFSFYLMEVQVRMLPLQLESKLYTGRKQRDERKYGIQLFTLLSFQISSENLSNFPG